MQGTWEEGTKGSSWWPFGCQPATHPTHASSERVTDTGSTIFSDTLAAVAGSLPPGQLCGDMPANGEWQRGPHTLCCKPSQSQVRVCFNGTWTQEPSARLG